MPELEIWKKQHFNRLKQDMDRLFDQVWGEFGRSSAPRYLGNIPSVNRAETEKHLVIRAEIPEINPKDLDIVVTDNTLTIKGETRQETEKKGGALHRTERRYGLFSRSFQLPCRVVVDDVTATYKDGVLEIIMPKCKPEKMRKLKVAMK